MPKENPTISIRPLELCRTKEGKKEWLSYRKEIIRLSLQYPNHFAPSVSKETIPYDALEHFLYIYPAKNQTISAYCVVIKSHLEAEMLWAAPDINLPRRGFYLAEVFRKIEEDCFSESSNIRMITGKVATPGSKFKKSNVGGDAWNGTLKFHQKMGYNLLYPLEHYWENGDHAIMMVKYRQCNFHGYDCFPEIKSKFRGQAERLTTERDPENQKALNAIYENLKPYLLQLEEDADWYRRVPEGAPRNIPSFQGFFGLGFFPNNHVNAALFVNLSRKKKNEATSEQKSPDDLFPHEYAIEKSTLLKLLANADLPVTGVIHYPLEMDQYSEVKVAEAFSEFLPQVKRDKGFSVFYHRYKGTDSHATLYAISPAVNDVVRQRRNWKNFAPDTFPLLWGLHDTLKVLEETHFDLKGYLKALRQCLPVSDKLKKQMAKNDERLLAQQFNFMQAASAHDLRSALQKGAIVPLARGIETIEKGEIEKGIKSIEIATEAIENFCDNLSFTIDTFRATLDEKTANKISFIDEKVIDDWKFSRQDPLCLKKLNIIDPATIEFHIEGKDSLKLSIHQKALEGILHLLINNALDAAGDSLAGIKVYFCPEANGKIHYCRIGVWNGGSHFPPDVLKLAGDRPLTSTIREGRSGMGLHVLENILRMSQAMLTQQQRHFELINTEAPFGASVNFYIKCKNNTGGNNG